MPREVILPNDVESLKRLVIEARAALQAAEARLLSRQLEIENLKLQIAQLQRMRFGRFSLLPWNVAQQLVPSTDVLAA